MAIFKLIRSVLLSDVVVVGMVVLLVSLLLAFGVMVLSWLIYNERYGVGLLEFIQLFL
ncbi:MAG: hypothetical protein QGI68_01135 [Pseudomonadales bacterium]|jgi:hypothetical protein|nr:hypothetical protein [Pseudomonadales bacterium]MDP7358199.1 hypothetical protein [Pseudomonadales bacterium]MDP7594160.1 hypothetical protein [Pseudomonadales bacterium]HJN53052.1 hypothetical protein [Pseudomonadales bacterium]|tara:strand:+ start:1502 stop:1675 length:174 start_codon:yes stop_codon:yes gene_type:complete